MIDTSDDAGADLSMVAPSRQGGSDPSQAGPVTAAVVSPLAFMRPRFLRPDPALTHLPFLFWLVEVTRPRVAVQLGLGSGAGYFGLCQALDRLDGDAACLGVAMQGEGGSGGGAVATELAAYEAQQHREVSTLVGEDALAAAIVPGPVDLLIVDGVVGGRGEALVRDWLPRLSDRSVIVTRGPAGLSGVEGPGVTASEEGEGLRAVLHGSPHDDRLRRLAALAPGQPGHSRAWQVFHRLGHALVVEAEAADREAALLEARSRLKAAEAKLRESREARPEHTPGPSTKAPGPRDDAAKWPRDDPPQAARIADLEGQVKTLRASEAARFKELATLARLIEERNERIDDLLNSTSWRLTGPIRHVSRWVGRRK